jgi:hypothetical protein
MGGSVATPQIAAAPTAPTLDNSADALEKARKQQEQAKGAAATMFSTQTVGAGGSATMAGSSPQPKTKMLGI